MNYKKYVIRAEKLKDIAEKEEEEGFEIDWEKSIRRPCEHCNMIIIYFKKNEN